jgi:glycosyltransferase involved in cell wall biosynthesis
MKILRITSSGFLEGGVENGVYLTNEILKRDGHEVFTISSDLRPDLMHFSDRDFKSVPIHGISKYFSNAFNVSAYKLTKEVLAEFKPDVVLLHTMSQATASVLFLLRPYPTLLFIHGPESFTTSLLPWHMQSGDYKHESYVLSDLTFSGRLRYYYFRYICGIFYALGLKNVTKFVALSHYTQRLLSTEGIESEYIANGAQLNKPTSLHTDPAVILYAGRLEKTKGVDDLVRAFKDVIVKFPKAQLRLAGEGAYGSQLNELVKELGITSQVKFLGMLSPDKLAKEYQKASVFVLPSIWPETFGKVGVEAMSAGRPVIATDVGGVRDWLRNGKNGFLVKPQKPDDIAAKLTLLLSDPELMKSMSEAAQKDAQKFSIEEFAKNIEVLAKQVSLKSS